MKEDFDWNLRIINNVGNFDEFFQNVGYSLQGTSSIKVLLNSLLRAKKKGFLEIAKSTPVASLQKVHPLLNSQPAEPDN